MGKKAAIQLEIPGIGQQLATLDELETNMNNLTDTELAKLENIVKEFKCANENIDFKLVEIKGTYYIYPEFPADS